MPKPEEYGIVPIKPLEAEVETYRRLSIALLKRLTNGATSEGGSMTNVNPYSIPELTELIRWLNGGTNQYDIPVR